MMECLSLWPKYIGEKGRISGKTYGIKVRCYWEHLGNLMEPIENLKEHVENKGKLKKTPLSPPLPNPPKTQNLKEKNQGTSSAC
jgi:hypothetical protein